jgi:hypothetical protein
MPGKNGLGQDGPGKALTLLFLIRKKLRSNLVDLGKSVTLSKSIEILTTAFTGLPKFACDPLGLNFEPAAANITKSKTKPY